MTGLHCDRREVILASVAEVRLGRQRSPKNHVGDQMRPYLRAANVSWSGLRLDDVKTMNFTDSEMDTYRLEPGDLLLGEASGSPREVGKPVLWRGEIADCAFQNTLIRVRPKGPDPEYLLHYFRHQALSGEFASAARGVGIRHLGSDALAKWKVPLPPLAEQRRVAEVLDQADALRAKRLKALAEIDDLIQCIFVDLFGNVAGNYVTAERVEVHHPLGWPWQELTQIATLATGHTPDRSRDDYWLGNVPWISLPEIRRLDGLVAADTDLHITEAGLQNSSAVLLPAGTVCLSRTASIGFVTIMGRPMATSQDFVNWIVGDKLRPLYLMHALLLSRSRLRALSDGSTHKTIYMRVAERFRILLPPLELQLQLEDRVQAAMRLKDVQLLSLVEISNLSAALQQRAFSGQL